MKKVKCGMEKPNLWSINIGLKHYDIYWDCKPLIEAFIEIRNDYTTGSSFPLPKDIKRSEEERK